VAKLLTLWDDKFILSHEMEMKFSFNGRVKNLPKCMAYMSDEANSRKPKQRWSFCIEVSS
jgi:hypothetical protein